MDQNDTKVAIVTRIVLARLSHRYSRSRLLTHNIITIAEA